MSEADVNKIVTQRLVSSLGLKGNCLESRKKETEIKSKKKVSQEMVPQSK